MSSEPDAADEADSPDEPPRVVLATTNLDKVAELAAILGDRFELAPRPFGLPDVVEDGDTLEDNARLKAVAVSRATGMAAMADDTGLEVDALDGAPGVRSARFSGENATYADNVAHLLERLDGVSIDERTARFRTVALLHRPDGSELVCEGHVDGVITESARGEAGFGYDPVFEPVETPGRTFAELDADEKHAISHRGRAFRTLAELLRAE